MAEVDTSRGHGHRVVVALALMVALAACTPEVIDLGEHEVDDAAAVAEPVEGTSASGDDATGAEAGPVADAEGTYEGRLDEADIDWLDDGDPSFLVTNEVVVEVRTQFVTALGLTVEVGAVPVGVGDCIETRRWDVSGPILPAPFEDGMVTLLAVSIVSSEDARSPSGQDDDCTNLGGREDKGSIEVRVTAVSQDVLTVALLDEDGTSVTLDVEVTRS